jgi:hypothetical protein
VESPFYGMTMSDVVCAYTLYPGAIDGHCAMTVMTHKW